MILCRHKQFDIRADLRSDIMNRFYLAILFPRDICNYILPETINQISLRSVIYSRHSSKDEDSSWNLVA